MRIRRWRLPLFLSGLALVSQAFPLPSPVRDAATLQWLSGQYRIHFPIWHVVFTPFCGVADMLTVLSLHEGIVFLVWLFVCVFALGGLRRGLIISGLFVGFLAWGGLVPRPMGALLPADHSRQMLIDFHSHSCVSHDGRRFFTPERNMEWHRRQGYDASFITDHNRIESAQKALAESRESWSQTGYRSLGGEEISLKKTHLVILGNDQRIDNIPYDSDFARIPAFIKDMHRKGYPVIASLPEYWLYHWDQAVADRWGPHNGTVDDFVAWGMDGFEIINSAPKALDFPQSDRLKIVNLCRRRNLFITGISDNHGYGYATAAWNAMRISGWRDLGPDDLQKAVISRLKTSGFAANQVLERVKFFPQTSAGLFISPIGNLLIYWRSLQPLQAVSWVLWIWTVFFLYPAGRKGNA